MTLDTRVYVHNPVDYREIWLKCNQLIGAHEGIEFKDEPLDKGKPDGEQWIWNMPGQGLCALLDVKYRKGRALIEQGEHHAYCEPDDPDESHSMCAPRWLEVSFDTACGYMGENGEGCGDLHARLVAQLGQWLDGKGIRWQWVNEFTSEVHWGYEGLTDLGSGGAKASTWFRDIVAPALGLDGAS